MPMKPIYEIPEKELALIIRSVKQKFKIPVTDEEIISTFQKMDSLSELEMMLLFKEQDKYCVKCGNCCRVSDPIDFSKDEFRVAAKHLGFSYKKLKKRMRGRPSRSLGGIPLIRVRGKPCPFLKGKNHCTIYDFRPASCQMYPCGKGLAEVLMGRPFQLPTTNCPSALQMLSLLIVGKMMDSRIEEKFGPAEPSPQTKELITALRKLPKEVRLKWIYDNMDKLNKWGDKA